MAAEVRAPIFKPIRSRFRLAGLSAGAAIATLSVFAAGAALAILLGSWTHTAEVALSDGERAELLSEYRAVATQLASVEKQRQVDGAASYEEMELSDAQARAVELARERGIHPGMSRGELEALVPMTRRAEVENLPFLVRVLLFVLVPTGGMYIALAEINRTSLVKEARRAARFSRSQKEYPCAPRVYLACVGRDASPGPVPRFRGTGPGADAPR